MERNEIKETVAAITKHKFELKSKQMMVDNPEKYATIFQALEAIAEEKVICKECSREVSISDTYATVCVDCFTDVYLIA